MSSSKLPVTLHIRPTLWHGRYRHSLRVRLPEASCLRSLKDQHIARTLEMRRRWGHRLLDTQGLFMPAPGSWMWEKVEITQQIEDDLYAMRDVLVSRSGSHHKTIAGDWIYIYTNDTAWLDQIESLPFLDTQHMSRGEIQQQGTAGTVQLKKPRHQYRTYLRDIRLESHQGISFRDWLLAQQDIRLSPSLGQWCTEDARWLCSYYFFDHDSLSVLTMLGMLMPRVIRKTLPLEKAK